MINANELRIGNVIMFSPSGKAAENSKRVVIVAELLGKSCITVDKGQSLELFYESASLQPIKLTPELLAKCGFEVATDEWGGWLSPRFGSGSRRRIRLFSDGSYAMLEARLNYLHQLQNIFFTLTGKELEYKS